MTKESESVARVYVVSIMCSVVSCQCTSRNTGQSSPLSFFSQDANTARNAIANISAGNPIDVIFTITIEIVFIIFSL